MSRKKARQMVEALVQEMAEEAALEEDNIDDAASKMATNAGKKPGSDEHTKLKNTFAKNMRNKGKNK